MMGKYDPNGKDLRGLLFSLYDAYRVLRTQLEKLGHPLHVADDLSHAAMMRDDESAIDTLLSIFSVDPNRFAALYPNKPLRAKQMALADYAAQIAYLTADEFIVEKAVHDPQLQKVVRALYAKLNGLVEHKRLVSAIDALLFDLSNPAENGVSEAARYLYYCLTSTQASNKLSAEQFAKEVLGNANL